MRQLPNANKSGLTRKEDVDKIRGTQFFENPNKGPAKKDSNRNDINDPLK
ncbi:hypothetical protein Desca_2332 [Desulfotomaculum nigrificans CO-1-SRB]|uniref:Uncharacterized protein n=1 Tax=Desulfotomaculum nigrificans (strain DSM 14880 / VKM B-2319 / CO-1-SRB) TaxID=868595 RepID=F6B3D6_DESCC|nr:hypothetical protein [Desulfotomaculum nigrificans]AEF95167.1 hypothetical protein Desca_2332 [Desulfotomaculum nigrificans CO-1-SRB]